MTICPTEGLNYTGITAKRRESRRTVKNGEIVETQDDSGDELDLNAIA